MNTPDPVKDIFTEAVERPREERPAFLDRVCGGRPDLRARVEELLRVHDHAGDFLGAPTHALSDREGALPTTVGTAQDGPGTVIDRYRLLEAIGEGGFGTVYMAEQEEPVRRKVALKIIKLGMDTKQVIARFEAERQALAMMDHPNIAKVFDAGATDTGRPYFVMELVKGVPIGEYCDTESLSTRQRLELFVQVCRAVHHAHQKGVIHRDIKPSNVMVTLHDSRPVPKVIDFGIAKATNAKLTEKTLFTQYRQLVGTPEYMSPEQAEMSDLDVDTRSDIYSLGVLLYELLTGSTPFDSRELRRAGYGEIQRIICEEEPPKPSTRLSSMMTAVRRASRVNGEASDTPLSSIARARRTDPWSLARSLRGDLDWIVMKALEKDRTRRYESAADLARDIERHLNNEAVIASPPSATYRLSKMVRRNRGTFVAAGLILAVLVLGIIGTSMGMVRAVRAERLAREKTATVVAVNEFLNRDLLAAVAPFSKDGRRREVLMREVLDVAAVRIEEASSDGGRFWDKPLAEASIRTTLSDTYRLLGDYQEAEPHARRAVEICGRVLGDDHPQSLQAMRGLATVFSSDGRYDDAEPLILKSIEIQKRTLGEDHPERLQCLSLLATVYCNQGRFEDAEPLLIETQEIERRVLGQEDPQTLGSMRSLAALMFNEGRYEAAESLYARVLDVAQPVLGEKHPETLRMLDEYARLQLTREPASRRDLQAALAMAEKLNDLTGHENPQHLETLALACHLNGFRGQALEHQRKAIALLADGGVRGSVATKGLGAVPVTRD